MQGGDPNTVANLTLFALWCTLSRDRSGAKSESSLQLSCSRQSLVVWGVTTCRLSSRAYGGPTAARSAVFVCCRTPNLVHPPAMSARIPVAGATPSRRGLEADQPFMYVHRLCLLGAPWRGGARESRAASGASFVVPPPAVCSSLASFVQSIHCRGAVSRAELLRPRQARTGRPNRPPPDGPAGWRNARKGEGR
jgi:hypothetical protein